MRSDSVSLCLLMPDESAQDSSTGSFLLDSLAKRHTHETAALRNLDLIKVNTSKEASAPQRVGKSVTRTEGQPTRQNRELSSGVKSEVEVATEAITKTTIKTQSTQVSYLSQPPAPSALPSSKTTRLVNDGKASRASAASVGLLDIDDTLLFGGAHGEISLADPYVEQIEDSPIYILAYLSQQVSAFTIAQLQNGFPNNADPTVINRSDPPKYHTILESDSFQLSGLDNRSKAAAKGSQLMQADTESTQDKSSAVDELEGLNTQIQDLNAQLEYLRNKINQVIAA